jgi:hypothetical protein
VALDEVLIEHVAAAAFCFIVGHEDTLADAENGCDVAAWSNLVVLDVDLRSAFLRHSEG